MHPILITNQRSLVGKYNVHCYLTPISSSKNTKSQIIEFNEYVKHLFNGKTNMKYIDF